MLHHVAVGNVARLSWFLRWAGDFPPLIYCRIWFTTIAADEPRKLQHIAGHGIAVSPPKVQALGGAVAGAVRVLVRVLVRAPSCLFAKLWV